MNMLEHASVWVARDITNGRILTLPCAAESDVQQWLNQQHDDICGTTSEIPAEDYVAAMTAEGKDEARARADVEAALARKISMPPPPSPMLRAAQWVADHRLPDPVMLRADGTGMVTIDVRDLAGFIAYAEAADVVTVRVSTTSAGTYRRFEHDGFRVVHGDPIARGPRAARREESLDEIRDVADGIEWAQDHSAAADRVSD
jgi:hypothetical protein